MSERTGCLGGAALAVGAVLLAPLLAIYALVTGKKGTGQDERPRLPYLAISRMHREDRLALQAAQRSADRCIEALYGPAARKAELDEAVALEVSGEIVSLLERVYELGERLAEARQYVKRHNVDAISREQADLELRLGESTLLEERESLREAMKGLEERARHAATVSQEIRTLSARLTAASSGVETLAARLARGATDPDEVTSGSREALRDVREQQEAANRVLQAYAATAREVGRLG
ncbi:MAG: hypothetical protein QGH45_20290 [Myxococcota bacterium]|nr:hypothetical protein [Myxococcota bacterium]